MTMMGMTMRARKMTTKKARPNRQMGILKLAVAAGSLAASLLGTRLVAMQDSDAALQNKTAVFTEPIVVNVPITLPTRQFTEEAVVNRVSPAPNNNIVPAGQGLSLDLPPIPQAVSPQIQAAPPPAAVSVQPVTSSRSSK